MWAAAATGSNCAMALFVCPSPFEVGTYHRALAFARHLVEQDGFSIDLICRGGADSIEVRGGILIPDDIQRMQVGSDMRPEELNRLAQGCGVRQVERGGMLFSVGQQCSEWNNCFVMRARRDALAADLLEAYDARDAAWLEQQDLRDEARKYWRAAAAERPEDARLRALAQP